MNPNFRDSESGSVLDQTLACMSGAFAWNNESGSLFDYHYEGTTSIDYVSDDGVNVLFIENLYGYGLLAETWCQQSGGYFTGFDVRFYDADVAWNGPGNPASYTADIWAVAAHEMGHALGLGHSEDPVATIYPTYYYGSIAWRDLASDDVNGSRARYGGGQPDLVVRILPEDPRRRFDSSGGAWNFSAMLSNTTSATRTADVWFDVRLPRGWSYGPVLGPFTVSLAAGQSRTVENLSLQVPPSALVGIYVVRMKTGRFPESVDDESEVGFQKIPAPGDFNASGARDAPSFRWERWAGDEMFRKK